MSLENELKHLMDKKVIAIDGNSIGFEDGIWIEFHPYETYVTLPEEMI